MEWKDYISPDGVIRYRVSENGDVLSLYNNKLRKVGLNNSDYKRINLSHGSKKDVEKIYIHRLVATLFIENDNPNLKTDINHKDGNKLNNHYTNLEWVTKSDNTNHAIENGLFKPSIAKAKHARWEQQRQPVHKVDIKTGEILETFKSATEAARSIGLKTASNIFAVIKGKRSHCHGFKWKLAEK